MTLFQSWNPMTPFVKRSFTLEFKTHSNCNAVNYYYEDLHLIVAGVLDLPLFLISKKESHVKIS